ncbi:uncharacterized protein BDR25DRAFT_85496 [Lindgomyces ingoldianus]|uniref:Uncharacterized protein n=1 Tax=Lindgomyces ingoldianus TaxID=673940 RepID=A0ACB6QGX4_9PLEO|nr:uncharacterized protein BDR25DRAFT_85496 [Lindgomyces ingoldianus]KAF2465612.1 hypothetical protein BDR25DRAFT_85496 [Lindgomyces ingoldianus]
MELKYRVKVFLQRHRTFRHFLFWTTSPLWYPICVILWGSIKGLWKWVLKKYDEKFVQPPRDLLKPKEVLERGYRRKLRDGVKPLKLNRRRALTLVSGEPETKSSTSGCSSTPMEGQQEKKWNKKPDALLRTEKALPQSTIDQLGTCEFYKLPFEIRELIWKYAVGGHFIHITRKKGRLSNVYCPAKDPTNPDRRDICLLSRDHHGFYVPTRWPRDMRPLALIMTCRQIYSEAINFLYSLNTFSFDEVDVVIAFFATLLPHRKNLTTSFHFTCNFTQVGPIRNVYFEPRNDRAGNWRRACDFLKKLPFLHSLTISPSFLCMIQSSVPTSKLQDYFDMLGEVRVHSPIRFVLPWAETLDAWLHPPRVAGNRALSPTDRFKFMWPTPTDNAEWLGFFVPFHVQCLHCNSYTIIRKATRGIAQVILTREGPYLTPVQFPRQPPLSNPKLSRYWTFHSYCRGWMEFQYDWVEEKWSVTQGARRITDEEAELHLAEERNRYPELKQPHERLQGLSVRPHPLERTTHSYNDKHIDIPTKQAYYRNVGWTKN